MKRQDANKISRALNSLQLNSDSKQEELQDGAGPSKLLRGISNPMRLRKGVEASEGKLCRGRQVERN